MAAENNVVGTFSEAVDPGTVSSSTFTLTDSTGEVPARITYDGASRTATLDPDTNLKSATSYTATVKGGPSGVKDLAGNPLAADKIWSFTTAAATSTVLLQDDFESGGLGNWTVRTGGDGTAVAQSDVVKQGLFAARLSASSSTGSLSYLRRTLSSGVQELTVSQDVQVAGEGVSGGNVPLLRLFDDGGARVLSVYRQNLAGDKVYVSYGGTAYLTKGLLPLGQWTRVDVRVKLTGASTSLVEVTLNGQVVHSNTTATVSAAVRAVQLGNETARQPHVLYVDNVLVSGPEP